jgi:hypothetical protein
MSDVYFAGSDENTITVLGNILFHASHDLDIPLYHSDSISKLLVEVRKVAELYIKLAPAELQRILVPPTCATCDEYLKWCRPLVDAVSDYAHKLESVIDPFPSGTEGAFIRRYHGDRKVCCPLCNYAGTSGQGFYLSDGVVSHLVGKGSYSHCNVTAALFAVAEVPLYWDEKGNRKVEKDKSRKRPSSGRR